MNDTLQRPVVFISKASCINHEPRSRQTHTRKRDHDHRHRSVPPASATTTAIKPCDDHFASDPHNVIDSNAIGTRPKQRQLYQRTSTKSTNELLQTYSTDLHLVFAKYENTHLVESENRNTSREPYQSHPFDKHENCLVP